MNSETLSFSGRPSRAHVALAMTALAGLVLFILACRPSWSPDGQRVLYSYWDTAANETGVAVFDRKTHTSRVIWVNSDATQSGKRSVLAQWSLDGTQAILTIATDNSADVLLLPIRSQKPTRRYTLNNLGASAYLPAPQVGNYLFLGRQNSMLRLDLENGEVLEGESRKELDSDFGLVPFELNHKIMYLANIKKEPAPAAKKEAADSQEEHPGNLELGEVDAKDLSLHTTLTLTETDLKAKGIGSITGFLDVEPKSGRIALLTEQLKGTALLVLGPEGIVKIVEAGQKTKEDAYGNLQWSRDGKLIYVTALLQIAETARTQFAVVEVPLDGTSPRIDQILEGPKTEFDEELLDYGQIALSPDGKLIAVSNGYNEKVGPEKRGIFLLDVSQPGRPVSFYPAPALPAVPQKSANKTEAKPAAKE